MTAPVGQLNRRSVVPLYFQLQELLKERIETGQWAPGDAVPTERELCTQYEVSRAVVRQALAILEQDKQIVRTRGRGTIVAEPKVRQRAGGLSRILQERGPGEEVIALSVSEESAPIQVARELAIRERDPVTRITTLIRVRGKPLAITDSFLRTADAEFMRSRIRPRQRIPIGIRPTSAGHHLSHSSVAIETSSCSTWEGELLEIGFHGPVYVILITEHVRADDATRPFEVARAVYRADVVQFRFELAPNGAAPEATWELADAKMAS